MRTSSICDQQERPLRPRAVGRRPSAGDTLQCPGALRAAWACRGGLRSAVAPGAFSTTMMNGPIPVAGTCATAQS
jgi:hypothetical protein